MFRVLKVFTVGFLEIFGLRAFRVVCFRVLVFWCLGFWGLHGDRDSLFVGAFAPEGGDHHTSFRTARP